MQAQQRKRAKDDANARKTGHADMSVYREFIDAHPTEFVGFNELVSEARVLAVVGDGRRLGRAGTGAHVDIVLDRTPLYAEGGGQLADTGTITTSSGVRVAVTGAGPRRYARPTQAPVVSPQAADVA